MVRLHKLGKIAPKNSAEVKSSRIGLGFEKLDRAVFDPEKAYDKVAELGVKWVRIQSGWARTEREKGVYDFLWLDSIVDNLVSRGLRPWICLCYGNGIYSEDAAKVFGAVGVPPIFTEEQRSAWLNYVRVLVARYKDRVTHYEVWNEPDGRHCWKHGVNASELGRFTAETGGIIHEVFPDAEVIGFVQCVPDLKYINDAFSETDIAANIDAISFHQYSFDETEVPLRVASLHAVADKYKKGIRIIQGESGSQSRSGGHGALRDKLTSESAQMKQLARHTMIDLSTDVEFTSYFSCMDMIEALNGTVGDASSYLDFGYFGVLGADFDENGIASGEYTPKPSYYSLQTIASVFSGDYETVRNIPALFFPSEFAPYSQRDCSDSELQKAYYRRADGSDCFVYWKPANILTTEYHGTVSLQLLSDSGDHVLVDLCSGDVYEIPDSMREDQGSGCFMFSHLPVTDYPLALMSARFVQ